MHALSLVRLCFIFAFAQCVLGVRECGRKRDEATTDEQVLTAYEMKSFLMRGGKFTSANGTTYEDIRFEREQQEAVTELRSTIARRGAQETPEIFMDQFGNLHNKPTMAQRVDSARLNSPDSLLYFSSGTAMRWGDLVALELELLADSAFEYVEFHGMRWDRAFLEASRDLLH